MPASNDRGNERSGGGGGEEAEAEEKTDGWMATYSDMVTLLLTFFVLMVAMSATDSAKLEMFLLAMSRDGITAEQFWEIQDKYNFEDVELDSWDDMWPLPGQEDEEDPDKGGNEALENLAEGMQEYIDQEELGEVIELTFNGEFLLMTLAGDILFDSGVAYLSDDARANASIIANMLAATFVTEDPFEVVVAGHTDNVPINTPQYPSNWHLSRDRSINFLWEMLSEIPEDSELDPGYFYARACGEYRPVATNSTSEGRAKNRRVEVMVSLARDNPAWRSGQEDSLPDNVPTTQGYSPASTTPGDTPYDDFLDHVIPTPPAG